MFLKEFLIFFVLIYIIMPDFSQLFCNFWGEFCAWCAGKHKYLKIYGDDRTAETSHYRKWKAIFPLYYHTRSLASKTKSNRERIAFSIFFVIYYFPMQKCLKILFSVSWLLIWPPVISPSSSSTIFKSSAMMSPLIPISIDSNTRERESWARRSAS